MYRLIAQGTVEELMYMRQLYKRCLSSTVLGSRQNNDGTMASSSSSSSSSSSGGGGRGQFEGVEGDTECRGELFGIQNLFQFQEGSILKSLRVKYGVTTAPTKSSDISRTSSSSTSSSSGTKVTASLAESKSAIGSRSVNVPDVDMLSVDEAQHILSAV